MAYTRDDADPATRPVTFAVNGGPGASSAYLHLLAIGPWRLPLDGPGDQPFGVRPTLVPNAETWLDFTDLVFIDPPGTGYSRVVGGDQARERFYSVQGDIDGLAAFNHALAEGEEPADLAEILRRRELWRLPRAAPGAEAAERPGHRLQRARSRLAGLRFRLARPGQRRALDQRGAFAFPCGSKTLACRAGVARQPAGGGGLCFRRVSRRSHARPSGQAGRRARQPAGGRSERARSRAHATAGRAHRHAHGPKGIAPRLVAGGERLRHECGHCRSESERPSHPASRTRFSTA